MQGDSARGYVGGPRKSRFLVGVKANNRYCRATSSITWAPHSMSCRASVSDAVKKLAFHRNALLFLDYTVNLQTEPIEEYKAPSEETAWSRVKKALAPLGVIGVLIAKFFAKLKFVLLPLLKFLPILLKSGGTMLLMIWIYTQIWGWQFALGFVLLLLVHETGHLLVAKKFGLKVGVPVFIPFMGAFIALKEAPRNAWMEACVGIGGPMLGSLGALV